MTAFYIGAALGLVLAIPMWRKRQFGKMLGIGVACIIFGLMIFVAVTLIASVY